jgi:hypothetical protein
VSAGTQRPAPRVAVVADDLIWSGRLADGIRHAGGEPVLVRSLASLDALLPTVAACVVDLTSRAYEGVAAVAAAARYGVRVIAVGQHDDADGRRAARQAGAARVYAYRTLFERGDRELAAWVASLPVTAVERSRTAPASEPA